MDFIKKMAILWLTISIFIALLFLSLTLVRIFDNNTFDIFISKYESYALFDADTSLVYEGE